MPLTQKQLSEIDSYINAAISDLLTFPSDRKSQALHALQCMLKDELTPSEIDNLINCPASIKTSEDNPILVKVFAKHTSSLGNVELIQTLLKKPSLVGIDDSPETASLITKYIREQITKQTQDLENQHINPIKLLDTARKGKTTTYNDYIKNFINSVRNDATLQLGVVLLATSLGMGGATYLGIKLAEYLTNETMKELESKIKKDPHKEQELIAEFLEYQLTKGDNNIQIVNKLLPRITDLNTYNIILKSAAQGARPETIRKILPLITNIQTLDNAYNIIKNKNSSSAASIANRQQNLSIQELESAIAKYPEKTQDLIFTALTKQLSIYKNNKAIINKFLPHITNPNTFNTLLKLALEPKNLDIHTISELAPHATDLETLKSAYEVIEHKDYSTARIIEKRLEKLENPLIVTFKEAISRGEDRAITALAPKITDQSALSSAIDYAIHNDKDKLLGELIPHLTDQKALGKALLQASRIENNEQIEQISARINDQKAMSATTKEAIRRRQDKAITALIPKITDQDTFSTIVDYAIYRNKNELLGILIPHLTDLKDLGKAMLQASHTKNNAQIIEIANRIDEVKHLSTETHHSITDLSGSLHAINNAHSLTTHISTPQIAAPHSAEVIPYSHLPEHSSVSQNTNFAIQTMLAIATVLKICGMDKFAKFALPSEPIKINPTHPKPTNTWESKEFEQLLRSDPKAQVLANSVTEYIKLNDPNNQKQWTQQEVLEFVNSPKFKEAQQKAVEMEKNMRRATEKDFGIEPTKEEKKLSKTSKYSNKENRFH
ncbi:MAG: hypothetical protein WBJ81_03760 [Rickettsiales bacterium]